MGTCIKHFNDNSMHDEYSSGISCNDSIKLFDLEGLGKDYSCGDVFVNTVSSPLLSCGKDYYGSSFDHPLWFQDFYHNISLWRMTLQRDHNPEFLAVAELISFQQEAMIVIEE